MKSIFYWLLLIAIFKDVKISQCGVIRRDLTWKKESEEAPNINANNSHSRLLNLNTNHTSHILSETNVLDEKPITLSSDFQKMLNHTYSNIENLTFDAPSKEEFERPIRSSDGKQCRVQLLTYNPTQFTSHDLNSNTDSQIASNRTERQYLGENQPEEKKQQPAYLNEEESRKTKLDYSNKENPNTYDRPLQGKTEVCMMQESKKPAQVSYPNVNEYLKMKGRYVKTEKSSEMRPLIRSYSTSDKDKPLEEDFAQEKECCAECIYQPGGIHLKEISNPYEKNDDYYRLNDKESESDDYVIKVQHPYGTEKQSTEKENLVKNDVKEYHKNTPTDNVQEDFAPVNTNPEWAKYAPTVYYDDTKYSPTDGERSYYKYPVKRIDTVTPKAYESNNNKYTLQKTRSQERVYNQEQVHHPQQKLNMLYTPEIIYNNPSGYEHHNHNSYYTSNNEQFNKNYYKQTRENPVTHQSTEVYHHDSEAKQYLKRPVNRPSIREIIFPNGGYLQAGEYIFHDTSNSSKNIDKYALNQNVIDRLTISSGGHIHKGKYAFLDDDYPSDGQGEGYYGETESIGRVKKDLDGLFYDESPNNSKYNLESSDKFDVLQEMNYGRPVCSESDEIQKMLHKRTIKPPALVVIDANLVKPVLKGAVQTAKHLIDSKAKSDRALLKMKVDHIINTIKNKKLKPLPKLPSLTGTTKISHQKLLPGILPYHKKDSLYRSPLFSKDIGNHVHAKETVININQNYGAPVLPVLRRSPVKHAFNSHYVSPREYDHSSKVYYEKPKYVGHSLNPFTNNAYNRDYFRTSHIKELDDQPNKFDLLKSLKLPSIHVPEPVKVLSKHYKPSHRVVVYPEDRYLDYYDRPYEPIRHDRHEPVYQIAPRLRHQYHNSKSVIFENSPPSLRLGRECRPVIYDNDPQPQEVEYAKYGHSDTVRPDKDGYYVEKWLTDGDELRQPRQNLETEINDGNLYYTKKNHESHSHD